MRMALVVVMVAACDGGTQLTADAGPDAAPMPDASVDAADPGIVGTWRDTYHTVAGPVTMSVCGTAPSAVVVDSTTAAVTPYPGTCMGDGSFRIHAPVNLGTYYLRVQGALYETSKRAGIDLSTERLGRSDVTGVTGVSLALDMTNLQPWTTNDVLMAFGANIGFFQNVSFTTGGPTTNGTTVAGSASWHGYKVDSAKSDALQIVQLGGHTTTNGHAYLSLDRVYEVPSFAMSNNTAYDVDGAFVSPSQDALQLNINVASFHQFAAVTNPNTTTRTIAGFAYAAVSPDVIPSPSLIQFARDSSTVTALNLGSLPYGDPFPAGWQRYVKIQEAFQVPYTWNNVSGSLNGLIVRVMPKSEAEAAIIDARLGPPRNPKFDGDNAFTDTVITQVPVVSWDAPSLGTPTDYEIQVYEVQVAGTTLSFQSKLRLVTKQTSVRIPSGYLLGQRQYVFVIRARSRTGVDVHETPLRTGTSWSSADTLSALVTTDF